MKERIRASPAARLRNEGLSLSDHHDWLVWRRGAVRQKGHSEGSRSGLRNFQAKAPGEWGSAFGDPVVATAILDRLVVITIRGDSYRVTEKRRTGLLQKPAAQTPNRRKSREASRSLSTAPWRLFASGLLQLATSLCRGQIWASLDSYATNTVLPAPL